MTAEEVSQEIANATDPILKSGFVVNINTGSLTNPTASPIPLISPEEEARRKKQQLYIAGGILAIIVIVVFYISFKKRK